MAVKLVTGHSGEPHVTSADAGAFNAAFIGDGKYVLWIGNQFALTVDSATQVTMQTGNACINGRHVRSDSPTTLTLEPGTQGTKRNDLVVLRYTKALSGIESVEAVVVKGEPTTGTPTDPAVSSGSILSGAETVDMPLWRIPISGISVGSPVRLFATNAMGVSAELVYEGDSSKTNNQLSFTRTLGENETILICYRETVAKYYNSMIVKDAPGKRTTLFTMGVAPNSGPALSVYAMGYDISKTGMSVVRAGSQWEVARGQIRHNGASSVTLANVIAVTQVYVLKGI